jgi:5-(carboxyamino)imidazole ribonucleotide synthase
MTNLIGNEINGYEQWLTVAGRNPAPLGESPPRPG